VFWLNVLWGWEEWFDKNLEENIIQIRYILLNSHNTRVRIFRKFLSYIFVQCCVDSKTTYMSPEKDHHHHHHHRASTNILQSSVCSTTSGGSEKHNRDVTMMTSPNAVSYSRQRSAKEISPAVSPSAYHQPNHHPSEFSYSSAAARNASSDGYPSYAVQSIGGRGGHFGGTGFDAAGMRYGGLSGAGSVRDVLKNSHAQIVGVC